jgi:TolB-like protein
MEGAGIEGAGMDALAMDKIFLFEGFRLDRRGGGLFRRDERGVFAPIAIGSRALDVLGVLVGRPGDLVSRDKIIAAVWPSTVVEDSNLNMQIAALRRLLENGRAGGSCIQTVPGRGYRFLPTVTRVQPTTPSISSPISRNRGGGAETEEGHGASLAAPFPSPDKPSIAVLPFANLSGDVQQEYFADGIVEEITTAISRLPWLFVIARNSSFTYKGRAVDVKQVARELGVRYVLEGSLRKSGNRIRLIAQLVEAETGKHAWAERYDRELADIFAVQDEIAGAVTTTIAHVISNVERLRAARKPSGSLDAWTACQRGWWHMSKLSAED